MKDLKSRSLRGGLAKGVAQAANFLLRMGCLVAFARLLDPRDFGLVGMVTAITGLLSLFREFGLSLATVQRSEITEQQTSTLFWINMVVGFVLCVISVAIAPLVASFYHEDRLALIMGVLGLGFIFNAAGVQHSALLQRQMRFAALAIIDVIALLLSSAISLVMAFKGLGYWSLVAWSTTLPLVTTLQLWAVARWVPGKPSLNVGAGSLLRFGSIVTLNTLVIHVAYNLDKVLLGRFWGADVVGIYGRAFQLVTLPTEQITGTLGTVAISVLSRLQGEPSRLWAYFRKGYSLVLAVTIPIGIMCAIFADQIILVLFGPKWADAIPVFRVLVPTVLVFAIINPTGWLLVALGMVVRSLNLALAIAPVVITGCVIGLPYGAVGVATGFSIGMTLWVVPHLIWCFHGTGVAWRDVIPLIARPFGASGVAALCALGVLFLVGSKLPAFPVLVLGCATFMIVYLYVLLFVLKQSEFFLDIVRTLRGPTEGKALVAP
jgi:O-antigen/teichoic acid export membrane protein